MGLPIKQGKVVQQQHQLMQKVPSHNKVMADLCGSGALLDADSGAVSVDTHCSRCMTHVHLDKPGELKECNQKIEGLCGVRQFRVWSGMMHCTWDDNEGAPVRRLPSFDV